MIFHQVFFFCQLDGAGCCKPASDYMVSFDLPFIHNFNVFKKGWFLNRREEIRLAELVTTKRNMDTLMKNHQGVFLRPGNATESGFIWPFGIALLHKKLPAV